MHRRAIWLLASLLSSAGATAGDRTAELEARLRTLETAVADLRAELAAARANPAGTGAATPAASAVGLEVSAADRLDTLEARLAAEEKREGFRVGRSTIRAGGFVKMWAAWTAYGDGAPPAGALVRDFYLPQQIPVGGARATQFAAHAKQTRLWLSASAPAGGAPITAYVEGDFQTAPGTQGTARTTNGYNFALRRATASWRGLTVGQDWSTFQTVAALPETTDFIGPTEGTIFVRQPLVRWTQPLGAGASLALAAENPITSSITTGSVALKESDDARFPDLVAKIAGKLGPAELTLAGLAHDVSVTDGTARDSAFGWGLSLAGRIPFGPANAHDLRFMLTGGKGIGHYVGLNFAPDGVFASGRVHPVGLVAGFAALKIGWSPMLRSTVMASFQQVDYPAIPLPPSANKSAWSVAGNLFATPQPGFDVGLELRHGERELLSGARGAIDRVEFVTKYSF
jgi:hypothetical protein